MKVQATLLASILAATVLLAVAPAAQAKPVCQQLFYGPDIDQGVCVDPVGDCVVLLYDNYGSDTCVVPGVTLGVQPACHQLIVGLDEDQGVCYDFSRDTCQVWYYRTYQNPGETCFT